MGKPNKLGTVLCWANNVNWPRIIWTLLNFLVLGLVAYLLVYLPLAKKLIMNERDQFMWNVFALFLTMWTSYQFARMSFKREVFQELAATARSALNRIFEAQAGVAAILDNIDARLSQLDTERVSRDRRPSLTLQHERLVDIRHQVSMVDSILRYAVMDWRSVLPQDFARQQQEEAEYVEAQRQIAELGAELDAKAAELEEEKGAKAEANAKSVSLAEQVLQLTKRIDEQMRKAAAASREAPFPMGTASKRFLQGKELEEAEIAFLKERERALKGGSTAELARGEFLRYLQDHPEAGEKEVVKRLEALGFGLSVGQTAMIMADPAVRKAMSRE